MEPGSLIKRHVQTHGSVSDLLILDAGCGEGKNATYLAQRGATVHALDISELAIRNALRAWPLQTNIMWKVADVRNEVFAENAYDLTVSYGLFHCLSNSTEIVEVVQSLKQATKRGGVHLTCSFNSRSQDLGAHGDFKPCLVSHSFYVQLYHDWEIIENTDSDLSETHPHNGIRHTHSMTRIVARKL